MTTCGRVLVIDDERSNCDIVSTLLVARGYSVDVALDGEAALRMVETEPYSLAVIDYQMPKMNGVEFFRKAHRLRTEMRGLFLTAYTGIDTVFPAISAGVERVLAKPANARELIPAVEELIGPRDDE